MAGKKGNGGGETSKKAQGQARKAEAAADKKQATARAAEAGEADKWQQGAKDSSKAEAARAKQEEAARKKAEKAALAAADEASLPAKVKSGGVKKADKKKPEKKRTLDLGQLDDDDDGDTGSNKAALNATGIDNALDALSLAGSTTGEAVDRHPERRFKAAYAVFEQRRLDELAEDKTLRRNQKIEQIRREFEKHPDNPFNQASAAYNASRGEVADIRDGERRKVEARLAGGGGGAGSGALN